ncbi:MAG: 3,4-dihydroxy-2-butanone-4-phosphate synthase [Dehalococcoidia bacterium]
MRRYASVEEAIEALAEGRVLIVVDSEDRENEGDFLAAAETITPEIVHFMTSQARGHFCMPISPLIAKRLVLKPMVPQKALTVPCFTIPVDHRQCKTGISPLERTMTIQAILNPHTRSDEFIRPGHIFPLIAQEEGVLRRPGHTEATVDLARLAGLTPAGVLCEICSRDGLHMADGRELCEIADQFRLPIVTIDDVIEFRRRTARSNEDSVPVLNPAASAQAPNAQLVPAS